MKPLGILGLLALFSCSQPVVDDTIHLGGYYYEYTNLTDVYFLSFLDDTQVIYEESDQPEVDYWNSLTENQSSPKTPTKSTPVTLSCVLDQTTDPKVPTLDIIYSPNSTVRYLIISQGLELQSSSSRFIKKPRP
ncbi:MAG: hypothetical protein A2Z96_04900 [Spirochaetes bacterium GWB1_48_6]|nr:MAG: hypothetical protein A2Z96_04900 [Spirochaetes bacterium GWB1_48_6]